MKLLHVVPSYIPAMRYGGTIHSVHGLCRALVERNHQVNVFTTNVDGDTDSDVPVGKPVVIDGVNVTYFRSPFFRRFYLSPAMGRALKRVVGETDIVHLHSMFLWPTWVAARHARARNVPYVLSPRGMLVKNLVKLKGRLRKNAWIALIERRNLEGAAAVHFTSQLERDEAAVWGFRLRNHFVVPNGVDLPGQVSTLAQSGTSDETFVFIGRISWKKGLGRLIEAVSRVGRGTLVIAGNDEEGLLPELKRQATKLGLIGRVRFIGPVYGEEKWSLLRNARAAVLPSYSENFGNSALEAMAMGVPVIVTPQVGLSDVVASSGCGIVTEADPEPLSTALLCLLDDPILAERMGRSGRAVVERTYSWGETATAMESEYELIRKEWR